MPSGNWVCVWHLLIAVSLFTFTCLCLCVLPLYYLNFCALFVLDWSLMQICSAQWGLIIKTPSFSINDCNLKFGMSMSSNWPLDSLIQQIGDTMHYSNKLPLRHIRRFYSWKLCCDKMLHCCCYHPFIFFPWSRIIRELLHGISRPLIQISQD